VLERIKEQGFVRVRIDGEVTRLEDALLAELPRYEAHTIEVVVDRLRDAKGERGRVDDSVETALKIGRGQMLAHVLGQEGKEGEDVLFSSANACPYCGISLPPLEPRSFSFNSPFGACQTCGGIGSIRSDWHRDEEGHWNAWELCTDCNGRRLKPEFLAVRFLGKTITDIVENSIEANIRFFEDVYAKQKEHNLQTKITSPVLKEIVSRLGFLMEVGLDYLTLGRESKTLAGGEAQRIQLATQLGSRLSGVLYILDEPSIGLHMRDHVRLIKILKELRDLGNTVIVVEHDRESIKAADWIIDLGPGGGERGGKIIFQGDFKKLQKADTLTGKYISGQLVSYLEKKPRISSSTTSRKKGEKIEQDNNRMLTIRGVREHNLKNVDVSFPLGKLVCVTGVSGSGKSSLVYDVVARVLEKEINRAHVSPGAYDRIEGLEYIDRVASVDQRPIGRTPRSIVATYSKIFDDIRLLFAQTTEARTRGWKAGRFSFNARAGRCDRCQGQGEILVQMQFLPDVYVHCEVCKGKRFKQEVLEVEFKGKDISQVLDLTVHQALAFFSAIPAIRKRLEVLDEIGLDYIRIGQIAPTLSGGEAQRIKLAKELLSYQSRHTFYILDEPTTGLHFDDVRKLLLILDKLVKQGNTVVVIEHNLDVMKSADWIIDLGPEGGDAGGRILAEGTPRDIAKVKESWTGQFLKHVT